jgi:prevent-host-death family protein
MNTETIPISRFKATCLAVLERVRATGQPVLVTKFGRPIAQVIPPSPAAPPATWLGAFRARGRITGDVTLPVRFGTEP